MGDLEFEKNYWNTCVNTFDEDQKHYVYARLLGIPQVHYSFDAGNKRILDIGGGPTSMLLKCVNLVEGKVCDPIDYPLWTKLRYKAHNIQVDVIRGEDIEESGWDEVWVYNCLQHVDDVEELLFRAKKAGKLLRIFEWIDVPPHEGHPQFLTKQYLDWIIKMPGNTTTLAEQGCYGTAYYGVFPCE
jgi:hypothetical protein